MPENHALAIAIMSYNGGINFGLLADYDAMDDVGLIGEGIEAEISELVEAARRTAAQAKTGETVQAESANGGTPA